MSLTNDRGQLSRRKLEALADTVAASDRLWSPGGLTHGDARVERGPFGFQVRDDTFKPFWARLTDSGPALAFTLARAVEPGDEVIYVTPPEALSGSAEPVLTAPFGIVVNDEAMTVTGFGEEESENSTTAADSTSHVWRVSRPLAEAVTSAGDESEIDVPRHAAGDGVIVTGTAPYAWTELREAAPGAWQGHDEGRTGTITRTEDSEGNEVLDIQLPAYEVSGLAAQIGGIVRMWLAFPGADYYLFSAPTAAPMWARITSADVTDALVVTDDTPPAEGYSVFTQASPYRLATLVSLSDSTLVIDSAELLPPAAPYLMQINEEVVAVTAAEGTTLTVSRAQLGTINPGDYDGPEELAPPEHEEGDPVYLFRVRYGWEEVEQLSPGTWTTKPSGRTDEDYAFPAYESSNGWVPINGSVIAQLWPMPGNYFVFQRPAGLTMLRFAGDEPDGGSPAAVNTICVLNADRDTGLEITVLGPCGVLLSLLPAARDQAGVVSVGSPEPDAEEPTAWQQLGLGTKSSDGWGLNTSSGSFSGVALTNRDGLTGSLVTPGFYTLNLTTGAILGPADVTVGDLTADGDATVAGTVEADDLVGDYDDGTWS